MSRAPLTVVVPGRLINPLNVSAMGVWKHRRAMKNARERTAEAVRVTLLTTPAWRAVPPGRPKRIAFHVTSWNSLDDDGLVAACKPARDGLIDARLILGDAPRDGHVFTYSQQINRKVGASVAITIAEGA